MESYWFWFLITGIVAGWIAGQLTHGHGFGLLGNLAVGVLGALVGGWLFSAFGLWTYGFLGALFMATCGAVILLFVVGRLAYH